MSGIPPLALGRSNAATGDTGAYVITIQDWIPTPLNKLLGAHWSVAARKKKSDARMIWAYSRSAQVPLATGKRSVQLVITLAPKQRAFDPDAPWKSLLDALVQCGLLTDDNRQGVELLPIKFERGERKATRIELKDLK
jgi:hypothetical protein